jgi:hypothetical protein
MSDAESGGGDMGGDGSAGDGGFDIDIGF